MRHPVHVLPDTSASSPTRRHPSASLADAPTGEGVYLLAFYKDGVHVAYGVGARGRALHYAGYASNIRERLARHVAGEGSRLCRAVARAGYELRLVRVWHGMGREYERELKARHNLGRVCPVCADALASSRPTGEPIGEGIGELWSVTP